jgi:hypothetical protein
LTFVSDPHPADWVISTLRSFDRTVGSIVPPVLGAYCRLFHPAWKALRGGQRPEPGYQRVRWADIARAGSLNMHAEVQFETLDRHERLRDTVWDVPPDTGHLPIEIRPALTKVLRRYSHGGDCWYLIWEGWGGLRRPDGIEPLDMPGRRYYLARGDITTILSDAFGEVGAPGPSLWWSDGQEWCVATEIDLRSTYIGAPRKCIETLIHEPDLEVLPATIDDDITIHSDRLNFGV